MTALASPRLSRRTSLIGPLLALVIAMVVLLTPTQVGGGTTYALVTGHSMEPTVADGTFVIARARDTYSVGDVVVYVKYGGNVMHRITRSDAQTGYTTRGDGNGFTDPWTVRADDIRGEMVLAVPIVGDVLRTAARSPLITAVITSLIVLASFLPRRRRVVTRDLHDAIACSEPEPRPDVAIGPRLLLWGTAGLTVASLVGAAAALRVQAPPAALALSLGGLLGCSLALSWIDDVVRGGRGLAERERALMLLSGRCLLMTAPCEGVDAAARDAVAITSLRRFSDMAADRRLPVLHRADSVTGPEDFLLLTGKGTFRWAPADAVADRGRHRVSRH